MGEKDITCPSDAHSEVYFKLMYSEFNDGKITVVANHTEILR